MDRRLGQHGVFLSRKPGIRELRQPVPIRLALLFRRAQQRAGVTQKDGAGAVTRFKHLVSQIAALLRRHDRRHIRKRIAILRTQVRSCGKSIA